MTAARPTAWALPTILAVALAVRVVAIFAAPSLNFADEAFQLFEQGHRLAFGYGLKPWEFDDGVRSYVVPGALGALFTVSAPVLGGPQGYLHFAQVALAILSLAPVAAVYAMGRRTSPTHALLASLVAATWFEIVYFSFRPLTESLAADAVVVALALASVPSEALSWRRLAGVGACLALAVMLRVHLAPAVGFACLWICRLEFRRRWLPLLLGATPVLAFFGAADWLTWGTPFASSYRMAWLLLVKGKIHQFASEPWYFYLVLMVAYWSAAVPVILFLVAKRLRTSALWVGFAAVVIVSHTVIPHKEYRYIFPALACLVIVAAMASADLVSAAGQPTRSTRLRTGLLMAAWVALSGLLAASPGYSRNWTNERGVIDASFWLSRRADLCGLAFYKTHWYLTGGYAFLHRDVPLYEVWRASSLRSMAYNYVFLDRHSLADFGPAYAPVWCAPGGRECLVERAGGCARAPGLTPLLQMPRLGDPQLYPGAGPLP